jgi:hypothetical protein
MLIIRGIVGHRSNALRWNDVFYILPHRVSDKPQHGSFTKAHL